MSAKRILHSILNFILILVAAIILWSCEKEVKISQEEEFIDYVSAYTTGIISRQSTIQVRLVQNYKGDESSAIPSSLGYLTFEPSINGETYWLDDQTIEFTPKEPLEPDTKYIATLQCFCR